MSKLRRKDSEETGPVSFIYSTGADWERWKATAVRMTPSPWSMLLSYPAARQLMHGKKIVPWTSEQLQDALQPTMRKIRHAYAGDWILVIERHEIGRITYK